MRVILPWYGLLLEQLRQGVSEPTAAVRVGVSNMIVKQARDSDSAFKADYDAAIETGRERVALTKRFYASNSP